MREKIIILVAVIALVSAGVFGTLYFTNNDEVQIASSKRNVTISESDSIYEAVDKIYDAVVLIETYQGGRAVSSGSGFVYKKTNKDAYILTNYHVVEGASEVRVTNTAGDEVSADFLGGDSYADIAALRIDADAALEVAELGDSTAAKIGDTVFTVGTPVGSEYMGTVTKGIISGEQRTITVNSDNGSYVMEALQTDASINPGNSGGPLVNINGEVIGVNSMKLVTSEIEGMGFAIPIEVAMASIDKLEAGEEIERPVLGISMYDVSNTIMLYRNNLKLDDSIKEGVVVAEVEEGSAAEKADIKTNDVIVKMDDKEISDSSHLKYELYKHEVGDTVTLTIIRGSKTIEKEVKLTESM